MKVIDSNGIRDEYQVERTKGQKLIAFVRQQLDVVATGNSISLAFPIDGRVKELESIVEKCSRKSIDLKTVNQFDDFVGIRVVCLFKSDIPKFHDFISSTFELHSSENTADRLNDESFGYQSNHYVVSLPSTWKDIPSIKDAGSLRIEIQVRTLSQHMWASVSHKLQYKIEASVPSELKRSINRASAILELIDIEFDRLLSERISYNEGISKNLPSHQILNLDVVARIMIEMLPSKNRKGSENFDEILQECNKLGIANVGQFKEIITKHLDEAIKEDEDYFRHTDRHQYTSEELIKKRSYFSLVGLMRNILVYEFGSEAVHGEADE